MYICHKKDWCYYFYAYVGVFSKSNRYTSPTSENTISRIHTWVLVVIKPPMLPQPDLGEPHRVHDGDVLLGHEPAGDGVRRGLPVDVPHPGAGDLEQRPAAAPHAHRHLDVLAAPDAHALVVGAGGVEEGPVDGEGAA